MTLVETTHIQLKKIPVFGKVKKKDTDQKMEDVIASRG